MTTVLMMLAFAATCYVQNMTFTASSRSRNGGDPSYHRKAALASNGVYWITNLLLTLFIVDYVHHNKVLLVVSGLLYTVATAEGSVLMMKLLKKKETGKRLVATADDIARLEGTITRLADKILYLEDKLDNTRRVYEGL